MALESGITGKVNVLARFEELLNDPMIYYEEGEVIYTFSHGYEKLMVKRANHEGSLHYEGQHHPNVVCEGSGICKWCGRTLEY